jgi:hypothetical protein
VRPRSGGAAAAHPRRARRMIYTGIGKNDRAKFMRAIR